jgi:hypothetical protein
LRRRFRHYLFPPVEAASKKEEPEEAESDEEADADGGEVASQDEGKKKKLREKIGFRERKVTIFFL